MTKQKAKKLSIRRSVGALILAVLLAGTGIYGGIARADKFDVQIKKLEAQNAKKQQKADQFAAQATSYQDAVNRLQRQIDSLQSVIDQTQKQSDIVKTKIAKAKADLAHYKSILGASIQVLYQEDQVSTIEILASSHDLSDFITKQEYRSAVQDKVQSTLDKITQLKLDLESQQRHLQTIIQDNKQQKDTRDAAQSKEKQLLNYSAGQKAAYDARIQSNNAQISALRAAQAAANISHFGGATVPGDPNHGGYPAKWDNLPMDYVSDDWGMLNRECVSYTAWKVFQTYGPGAMPYWGGVGNAIQWPSDARAAGIPTGSTPKAHSVAIWPVGSFGHAMWVENVYSNGYIRVSQYNYDYQGHYSEMTIPSSGLTYIYFR